MLTLTYPYYPPGGISPQYTYGYDSTGRLNTMTSAGFSLVTAVTYNAANQILSITGLSESRTYNTNGQMTNLTSGSYHYAYNYSATQNNGQITSMQDVASGETITYQYDSLNRLISAAGTGDPQGSWSQTFAYDGFGNLLSKIGNNAPNVTNWTVSAATNQITSGGAVYDANGNMTAYGPSGSVNNFYYDETNRLSEVLPVGTGSQANYSYDAANKRIYASVSTTVNNVHTTNNYVYLYGADGKKLGVWQYTAATSTLTLVSMNVWFGSRLFKNEDRLQSVGKYFPYGEDRYNPTPANPSNDQEKFATYTRDSISGLDYAVNRYYAAGMGRFMSPDPLGRSAKLARPQTLNRYAYTASDPIRSTDPTGKEMVADEEEDGGMGADPEGIECEECECGGYDSITTPQVPDPATLPSSTLVTSTTNSNVVNPLLIANGTTGSDGLTVSNISTLMFCNPGNDLCALPTGQTIPNPANFQGLLGDGVGTAIGALAAGMVIGPGALVAEGVSAVESSGSVIINLGGEGEVAGAINQQGLWILDPGWASAARGQSLTDLQQAGNQFVISSNTSLPFANQSIDTVITNGVPVDMTTWLGPGPQSNEIFRILKPRGSWINNGSKMPTRP